MPYATKSELNMSPHPLIAEGHEERIQRVEHGLTQVSTQIAEQGIKVGFMTQQIADTKRELTDKMDHLADNLTNQLTATCERIDKVTGHIEAQDDRIGLLETAETNRQKSWALVKKIIYTLFIGGAGVAVNELVKRYV
jgi:septal ring factor EnvC (AmiA/AmiB activator)